MRYELNRTNTNTEAEMRIQQNPRGKGYRPKTITTTLQMITHKCCVFPR